MRELDNYILFSSLGYLAENDNNANLMIISIRDYQKLDQKDIKIINGNKTYLGMKMIVVKNAPLQLLEEEII